MTLAVGDLAFVPNRLDPDHPGYATAREIFGEPGRIVSIEAGWAMVDRGKWGQFGCPVEDLRPEKGSNDYWGAVHHLVGVGIGLWPGREIGAPRSADLLSRDLDGYVEAAKLRPELVGRYSWTVSDPDTVAFVIEHAGTHVVDPLAGSGWWAHILADAGADVAAFDINPPDAAENRWHRAGVVHHPVKQGDARDVVPQHGDRTLLLAWPPYNDPLGADVLRAYTGDRIIYMGEVGDCCGDDTMVDIIENEWVTVAEHWPVHWFGIHDRVLVLARRPVAEATP